MNINFSMYEKGEQSKNIKTTDDFDSFVFF